MKKIIRESLFEAKLNLPQEYIDKVTSEARQQYGQGPTRQDFQEKNRLMNQIIPLQRGHEEELTELGKNIIQKFYGPVIEGVELDIKIVDPNDEEKLEMAQKMLQKEEQEEGEEEQPEIELDLPGIETDIDKRKLINNVMQGEAQNVHDMMYDMKGQVAEITGSNRLLDLYMQFLALNKKFDWDDRVNLEQMMEQMPQMANAMETDWEEGSEGEGDKPKIKARVLDLPMLIHETVKGIYELIASGAIDPDPVRAQKILKATDTLTDEQQDIRFGPYIARDLRNYVNKVADKIPGAYDIPNLREFVFGKMIQMRSQEFVDMMTSILMNEKGPETIITKFIKDIQDEFKQHATRQMPGYEEDLPSDVEEFNEPDIEDEELTKLMKSKTPETQQEKPKEDISKKLVSMSKGELNFQLNKAIDEDNWELAKQIQQMMERRGMLQESYKINEFYYSDKYEDNQGELDTKLIEASKKGHNDIVKMLLDSGANVNAKSDVGWTPLMWASANGHINIVSMLISDGADINAKTNDGRTSLLMAAWNGHKDIVMLLLDAKADANIKDFNGWTPLTLALRNEHKDVVELLKKYDRGIIKESYETTKSHYNHKTAVAFNIKLNWGGDVMFNESNFIVDTVHNFFNDKDFMEKINTVINELSENHSDDETFRQFMNGISTEEELDMFFNWVDSREIYSEGIIDAMDEETYIDYLNNENNDDEYEDE